MKQFYKVFLLLTARLELLTVFIPIPTYVYFIMIFGISVRVQISAILIPSLVCGGATVLWGTALRYYRLRKIFAGIACFHDGRLRADEAQSLKLYVLSYPLIESRTIVYRWLVGITSALYMFYLLAGQVERLTIITALYGLIFTIPISYVFYGFISEGAIRRLLVDSGLSAVDTDQAVTPYVGYGRRIFLVLLSVASVPTAIFGFMFYFSVNDLMDMKNPGLSIAIISVSVFVSTLILSYIVTNSIKTGLKGTNGILEELNRGNLRADGAQSSIDEFGRQGHLLKNVIRVLRAKYADVEDLNRNLESIIKERTRDLEETESRLANIINFLPDPVMVRDNKGVILIWNRAMERLTGIDAKDMIGKGDYEYAIPFYGERRPILVDLVLFPHEELEKNYSQIKRQGSVLFGEAYVPSLQGGGIYLSATAGALSDSKGNIVGAIETLRDRTEQKALEDAAEVERQKSENLLLNILPKDVAQELKDKGFSEAVSFDCVSVLFTDFKGFTSIAEKMSPSELIRELDACFVQFDKITERYNLEKLKTIGDSYMCAGGIPKKNSTHAVDCVMAALEIQNFMNIMKSIKEGLNEPYWELRLGIHSGSLVAGVIGEKKFAYDVWGDTVNTASRMESAGTTGKINISGATYNLVNQFFDCEYRGRINAKNKGEVDMYYVNGIRPEYSKNEDSRTPNETYWQAYRALIPSDD